MKSSLRTPTSLTVWWRSHRPTTTATWSGSTRRTTLACWRFAKRATELGIDHRYEEFPDNHTGVDYRMDESLPFLVKALSA